MVDTEYKLRYFPLFYEDLEQKVVYIAENLHNEKAAITSRTEIIYYKTE